MDNRTHPKVQVEVIKGSWEWACVMYQIGIEVYHPTGHRLATPHPTDPRGWCYYGGRNNPDRPQFAMGWEVFRVPPTEPLSVQSGTFPWAVAQMLEGKHVKRRSPNVRGCLGMSDILLSEESMLANDWYLVDA